MKLLFDTISQVKKQLNRNLEVSGILLTMVNTRTKYSKEIITILQEEYGEKCVFLTVLSLRPPVQSKQALLVKVSINLKKGKVAKASEAFVTE